MSNCRSNISSILVPAASVEPARLRSPTKRSSTEGDSSNFLRALATQDRRVLELREELQKAEDELLRLKKQWATHEAIKKRNEFRHLQQLQQLKAASHSSRQVDRTSKNEHTSPDRRDRPLEKVPDTEQEPHINGEHKAKYHISRRQIHRKVFAGSRHTRSLSLLTKFDTTRTSSQRMLQEPPPQTAPLDRTDTSSLQASFHVNTEAALAQTGAHGMTKGQPKEVFIETGKQLVGGLREGLWTFFEDIRQATVGEEASSSPEESKKSTSNASYNARMQGRQGEKSNGRHSLSENIDRSQYGSTSGHKPVVQSSAAQWQTVQNTQTSAGGAQPRRRQQDIAKRSSDTVDEDPWDIWDSSAPKTAAPCRKESVTSESTSSLSTGRNSPRSSMSSLDATPFLPNTDGMIKHQDIPWPALTKLSPGNLRMTASTLMNEWEKSLAQPIMPETVESAKIISANKDSKAD
ncbi:MAG: hypothetical protein Q9201_002187 [Fulgogasparrea decipioides]